MRAPILNHAGQPSWAHHPWFQAVFALFMVAAGVGVLVMVPVQARQGDVVASGEVCPSAAPADDCLVAATAQVTDRRRGRYGTSRWHLEPVGVVDDRWVEQDWVRFDGDETEDPTLTGVLDGRPVTALYAEGEPVALEVDGERVTLIGGDPGSWRRMALLGIALLGLGLGSAGYAWHRRDRPELIGSTEPVDTRLPVLHRVVVAVALGAFAAAIAGRWVTQLVVFLVVAGGFGALSVAAHLKEGRSVR